MEPEGEIPAGLETVNEITGAEIVDQDKARPAKPAEPRPPDSFDEQPESMPAQAAEMDKPAEPLADSPEKKKERERWRERQKKKRGRPLGSKGAAKFTDLPPAEDPAPDDPKPAEKKEFKVDNRRLAESIFSTWINLMAGVFGPEWLPREAPPGVAGAVNEAETIIEPLIAWLETFVVAICTPLQMLSFSVMMYSIQRIFHPNTRAKIVNFFKACWSGLMYLFRGKRPEKPRPLRVVQEEGQEAS